MADDRALDADRWAVVGGGTRWTQRAGTINADGVGAGFGGRSLCLSADLPPGDTYEVEVQSSSTTKAAPVIWRVRRRRRGRALWLLPERRELRLTRFDGPDVFSWTILEQLKLEAYRRDDWNHLRVRVEPEKLTCWVNGALVAESGDVGLRGGMSLLFGRPSPTSAASASPSARRRSAIPRSPPTSPSGSRNSP
ncbi:MAG: hypothetical protein R3F11_05355 [Verrucomicrobiales bacterium]